MGRIIKEIIRRRTKNWQKLTSGFCCYRTWTFKIQTWNANSNKKERKKTNCLSSNPFWFRSKRKRELRCSLNRYGFTYARRYIVNQAAKTAPGVIKAATNDINNIAEKRTNQFISDGGKESEFVLPKILRGTTEDIYQTPFTLLGEFFYLSFIT